MFSCEFCENFKNSLFTEHLWATASEKGCIYHSNLCVTSSTRLPINDINEFTLIYKNLLYSKSNVTILQYYSAHLNLVKVTKLM